MENVNELVEFAKQIQAEGGTPTYKTGGRGKKQCYKCKLYSGVRTPYCGNCGTKFEKGKTPTKESKWDTPPEQIEKLKRFAVRFTTRFDRMIHTPAGACPVDFKIITKRGLDEWCSQVIDAGLKDNVMYSPQALIYWLGMGLGWNSEEFKRLKKDIMEWADV